MRHSGLPLAISGSRANNTPCQTPLCPKRRPPRPQQPIFSIFHRGGLHFGHHASTNRDLTTTKREEFRYTRVQHIGDTPYTTKQLGHAVRRSRTGRRYTRVIGHVVSLGFVPCMSWCALLIRTWACYSEPGQPRPRAKQRVHMRDALEPRSLSHTANP